MFRRHYRDAPWKTDMNDPSYTLWPLSITTPQVAHSNSSKQRIGIPIAICGQSVFGPVDMNWMSLHLVLSACTFTVNLSRAFKS